MVEGCSFNEEVYRKAHLADLRVNEALEKAANVAAEYPEIAEKIRELKAKPYEYPRKGLINPDGSITKTD